MSTRTSIHSRERRDQYIGCLREILLTRASKAHRSLSCPKNYDLPSIAKCDLVELRFGGGDICVAKSVLAPELSHLARDMLIPNPSPRTVARPFEKMVADAQLPEAVHCPTMRRRLAVFAPPKEDRQLINGSNFKIVIHLISDTPLRENGGGRGPPGHRMQMPSNCGCK